MKGRTCAFMALALSAFCLSLPAHETAEKVEHPGFRPECESAAIFAARVKTATMAVYPTIIRTPTNTTFSVESQHQIVTFLNEKAITEAVSEAEEVDPGDLRGQGQFDWFRNDMESIGKAIQSHGVDTDYILVMEVLFPPTRGTVQSVFGIHCLVLDAKGANAFSFLLNSHHRMFVDAGMRAEDLSAESRDQLIRKATEVGLRALIHQIELETAPPEE